jgi:hypothetical protein
MNSISCDLLRFIVSGKEKDHILYIKYSLMKYCRLMREKDPSWSRLPPPLKIAEDRSADKQLMGRKRRVRLVEKSPGREMMTV